MKFNPMIKRGLALSLAVMMCISLLPTQVLAAEANSDEPHVHDDTCYGWACGLEEHTHDDNCYAAADDKSEDKNEDLDEAPQAGAPIEDEALTEDAEPTEDAGADEPADPVDGEPAEPVPTCGKEEHEHSDECWGLTCGFPADEEPGEAEEPLEPEIALATYVFVANGETVSTQTLADGDTLQVPAAPTVAGKKFVGWSGPDELAIDTTAVTVTVTEKAEITYTAQYVDVSYVTFADGDTVYYTAEITDGELTGDILASASAVYEAEGIAADESLVGWTTSPGSEDIVEAGTKVSDGATLYPVTAKGEFVIFDANGGSLTGGSRAKIENGSVSEPTAPTRAGYEFAGWYTQAEGGTEADFTSVTAGQTFYAHWNPGKADYLVQYWIENADDDGYTYVASETHNGTVGGTASVAGSVSELNKHLTGSDVGQFLYDTAASSKTEQANSGKTIQPDGSTVFNVYFSRKTYTLTFYGQGWFSTFEYYSGQFKYGADLSSVWEEVWARTGNDASWNVDGAASATYLGFQQKMPGKNLSLTKRSETGKYPITHKYETLKDGEYVAGETFYVSGTTLSYDEEYYDVTGFEQAVKRGEGGWYLWVDGVSYALKIGEKGADLYYNRAKFNLDCWDGAANVFTGSVKFEAPLDSYLAEATAVAEAARPGYKIEGWYEDPTFNTRVPDGATMPANNKAVYAKWVTDEVTVTVTATVTVNGEAQNVGASITLTVGEDITDAMLRSKINEQLKAQGIDETTFWAGFRGWKVNGEFANLPEPAVDGMVLVGTWYGTTYKVTYQDAKGNIPTDSKTYADGARATVLAQPTADKDFSHWLGSDGKVYAAGDTVAMNSNITLTAVYKQVQGVTFTLTYDPGEGTGEPTSTKVVTYTYVPVAGCGFTAPEGMVFDCWTYDGKDIQPGTQLFMGGNVTLVAKWKPATVETTVTINYYKDSVAEGNLFDTKTETVNVGDVVAIDLSNVPTGYKVQADQATSYTAQDGENVVNVVYVKDDSQKHSVSIRVEYYYGVTLDDAMAATPVEGETQRAESWIGDPVTVTADVQAVPNGYKVGLTEGSATDSLAANIVTNTEPDGTEKVAVYKVYYVKDDTVTHSISAQVEYYYGATLEDAKAKTTPDATDTVVTATEWIGAAATVTVEPNETNKFVGYTYNSTDGNTSYELAAWAETDSTTHVVKVYYTVNQYGYTIEYYKDEVADNNQIGTKSGVADFGTVITLTEDQLNAYKPVGYQDGELVNSGVKVSVDEKLNVVRVLYLKDDTATHSIKVTVEYYKDGVLAVTEEMATVGGWIGTAIEANVNPNTTNKFEGYQYDHTDGALRYTLAANEAGDETYTVKVYYEAISYSIEYSGLDGAAVEPANPTSYKVTDETITLTNPTKYGYTFIGWTGSNGDVPETNVTIPQGSTGDKAYTANWEVDASLTKKLSYTVEYYKDGELVETQVEETEVQVLQPDTMTVDASKINATDKYDGYRPWPAAEIPETIANGGTIKVYYVRDSFSYTVKHYKGDATEPFHTVSASRLFGEPIPYSTTAQQPKGYKEGVVVSGPEGMTITSDSSKNVVEIRYEIEVYTISYDLAGGAMKAGETNPETYTVETETFTLANPEREGYTFLGWTGTDLAEASDSVTVAKGSTGNRTYTAVWAVRTDLSYTVNYYLEGTTTSVKPSETVDGQTFGSTVTVTAPEIDGYNKVEPTSTVITIAVEGNEVTFYYTKRSDLSYVVKYVDENGSALVDEKTVENKTFGETYTETAVPVDGYTVDAESKSVTMTTGTNEIVFRYTKRGDLSYVVKYLDESGNALVNEKTVENKTFGETYTETAVSVDGYTVDAVSKSVTMTTGTNEIVFNYTKRSDLSYVVKYLDENGSALVDEKTVENRTFGETYTEAAVPVNGYTVDEQSKSVTMTTGTNEIVFHYTKRGDLGYTVNYLEQGTGKVLAEAKAVSGQTFKAEVTEEAKDITGYTVVGDGKATITIEVEGNVINFYYTANDQTYTVEYREWPSKDPIQGSVVKAAKYGDIIYAANEIVEIPGYNLSSATAEKLVIQEYDEGNILTIYYEKRTDLSYTVNYLEQGTGKVLAEAKTVNGQTFKDEVTEQPVAVNGYVAPEAQTITIGVEDNVINFYYTKRTDLSYTVNYIDEDTGAVLETKTVEDQTFEMVVTAESLKKSIAGYAYTHADKDSLTIGTGVNVINLYYSVDEIGTGNPNEGDGIPDKYQITVTFQRQIGARTDRQSQVVLTKYENGEPSENGRAYLSSIPAYGGNIPQYSEIGWGENAPSTEKGLTEDTTYTYRYAPLDIPVVDPTEEIPDEPVPEGPGLEEIEDTEVPLASAVGLNDRDHFAYIMGYEDDTVRPLDNITRAEVATILFRLMTEMYRTMNWSTTNDYTDVNEGDWYNNAISTCTEAEIVFGYEDGTFKPNQAITRAEFAAFAANLLDGEYTGEGVEDFTDTVDHWAAEAIRCVVEAGWFEGEDGMFRPDDSITRAEAVTVINRMLHRLTDKEHMLENMKVWIDNPEGTWYYEAIQEASNEHDYERDDVEIETWTELLPTTDWTKLEKQWAEENKSDESDDDAETETEADGEAE